MRFLKKKHGDLAAGCLIAVMLCSEAQGFFDAQVLVGQRAASATYQTSDIDLGGTEIKAAVHLDPIPLVPVGFGLNLSLVTLGEKKPMKSLEGTELSFEIMAWSPVDILGLTPYIKAAYAPMIAYKAKFENLLGLNESFTLGYKGSGQYYGVGLAWSPLPLLALLLEANFSNQKLEVKDSSISGVATTVSPFDIDVKANSYLLGLKVGI